MGKRIALLCMSLNIGGAETHIYELALGLTALGHEVTVFSKGGVYADALERRGIRHVRTPLHTKTPGALLRARRILTREFKAWRPSVVHSHTRISNYVGGVVCRRLKIPLVTTVHFNFRTGFFFRRFSDWGDRALAVSEDLKQYLIDHYRYPAERIALTVNGIDMERFCARDATEFRAALGIAPQEKMVLMVSRLDKEPSAHVAHLMRLAPALYRAAPQARIVIVGDGKLFPQFAAEADAINRACGAEFIRMQGAKTNIEQYTAAADLFVGVSRAALEAMASGVPTVLLGNLGYLGLYSDAVKDSCIATNLTCRGCPFPADETISALLAECLNGAELSENARQGRRLVREYYSVETMAASALAQYQAAIDDLRPLDYMISGYYGSDNFGDNLTLRCLMEHLEAKRGSVLTHNVRNTQTPESVQKIHRFHLLRIRAAMKKTKVFLLGSGSILQDATSNRSLFYYRFIMRMAFRAHCKVMLYANGIGPISRPGNRRKTERLLKKVDLITVRDGESLALLREMRVPCPTYLTADDAFSYHFLDRTPYPPGAEEAGKCIVGVNFKLDPAADSARVIEIAEGLAELAERHDFYYYLLPFHLVQDTPSLRLLQERLAGRCRLMEPTAEPEILIRHIAACRYLIMERLHGQIMAATLGTPFLPIHYDPKNRSLAEQMGIGAHLLQHRALSRRTLVEAFERLLDDEEPVRRKLRAYAQNAAEQAARNQEYLLAIMRDY